MSDTAHDESALKNTRCDKIMASRTSSSILLPTCAMLEFHRPVMIYCCEVPQHY